MNIFEFLVAANAIIITILLIRNLKDRRSIEFSDQLTRIEKKFDKTDELIQEIRDRLTFLEAMHYLIGLQSPQVINSENKPTPHSVRALKAWETRRAKKVE